MKGLIRLSNNDMLYVLLYLIVTVKQLKEKHPDWDSLVISVFIGFYVVIYCIL